MALQSKNARMLYAQLHGLDLHSSFGIYDDIVTGFKLFILFAMGGKLLQTPAFVYHHLYHISCRDHHIFFSIILPPSPPAPAPAPVPPTTLPIPAMILAVTIGTPSEDDGEVKGFSLIYSGNFLVEAEITEMGRMRVNMGVHHMALQWNLKHGQ